MTLTEREIEEGRFALQIAKQNIGAAYRTVLKPEQMEALVKYAMHLLDMEHFRVEHIMYLEGEKARLENELANLRLQRPPSDEEPVKYETIF